MKYYVNIIILSFPYAWCFMNGISKTIMNNFLPISDGDYSTVIQLGVTEILNQTLDHLSRLKPYDTATICLSANDTFHVIHSFPQDNRSHKNQLQIPTTIINQIKSSKAPVILNNHNHLCSNSNFYHQIKNGSSIFIPIHVNATFMGFLFFFEKWTRLFHQAGRTTVFGVFVSNWYYFRECKYISSGEKKIGTPGKNQQYLPKHRLHHEHWWIV